MYKEEYLKNENKAFPLTDGSTFANDGMTLLDYFAAKAMQGLIPLPDKRLNANSSTIAFRAKQAYAQAAAMMEERKKYLTDKK